MKFIYETHLHTIEASACSKTPAKDYIEYMLGLGYSGIIVTDHFFNGNCSIPKDLPWDERVELYCKGYEHALEAAKGTDLTVMFGIEFNFQGDEYLLYGVDKKWLLDNPEIMEMSRSELHECVNKAGGIMIQAHPYRERGYLSAIHLSPNTVDGVEVYNSGNPDYQNGLGYVYAKEHDFLTTAGSDIHYFNQGDMAGMSFPFRINTIEEYVAAFLKGDGTPVYKRDADNNSAEFAPVSEEPSLTTVTRQPDLEVITHFE